MAWDWIGATISGVVGITATYLTAKHGRAHTAELSASAQEHALQMAREERRQKRIGQAYEELLVQVELVGQWAVMVQPMLSIAGDPKPELPGLQEQARIQALVLAYGSPAVQERHAAWRQVIKDLIHADYGIRLVEQTGPSGRDSGIDHLALRIKIEKELRPAEQQRRAELADQIAEELRGLPS